ncbi:16S rRNA (cytosine(967)-C(5))-methyltransferase RsmB [Halolactibacillus alkaliphilus]|uniref:16S rRNA (cytosine(967)-C(5))-methyltransferase n=1 Tax=Halolactibacillus alkaliphilus TaxID=442899 RepID=A0A511WYN5_9BACI|nr:16S rRNA (cytosine(967)-C(5))-methyltransferase RsmB [Halolactibacillus alkaliphilus]GEN55733.1 ribosomal RNA small subunit methyltransferase B [Halolactibacillus alkaliphilus]SFO64155.1 16S rRNA (cytosine967-C5)-methyltransferase [Halolactibacillus alkaliphilus]
MSKSVRAYALDVLVKIGDNGAFSHLLIDQTLKNTTLDIRDQALFTELVYGTLNRKLTLEYDLYQLVKKPEKLQSWVKWLLYLAFYQLKYLDKVPDHAVVNEAVEIAKKRGHQGIVKLVNGVLRQAVRQGFTDYTEINEPLKQLSIKTSTPEWLIERWVDSYGFEKAEKIAVSQLVKSDKSVRVNPLKMTRTEVMKQLQTDGFDVRMSTFSSHGLVIEKGNILKHPFFKEGVITIQDQTSMLVGEMMAIEEGQIILDSCSAPGGKATDIAERLSNTGCVYSFDLHEKKTKLVKEKAEQLGLINIKTQGMDARHLDEAFDQETFDRILVDAPCSGFGVIRTKPDIKYSKTSEDVFQLSMIQFDILKTVMPLLKTNGKLIYSTCTIDPTENEALIAEFLSGQTRIEVDPTFFEELPDFLKTSIGVTPFGIQIFPDDFNTDGFFLTRLQYKQH